MREYKWNLIGILAALLVVGYLEASEPVAAVKMCLGC
jgi:hypothetical protein